MSDKPRQPSFRSETGGWRRKALFGMLLGCVLAGACWFTIDGQIAHVNEARCIAVALCMAVYVARVVFSLVVLIKREMPWVEVLSVTAFISAIFATYALAARRSSAHVGALDAVAACLFVCGSACTTGGEWARYVWKLDPAHKGRLYAGGPFAYSRNANYFGDLLSFSGFSLMAGQWWALWVPVAMALGFVFVHIPEKEVYLRKRYAREWPGYAQRTAALIPFIY